MIDTHSHIYSEEFDNDLDEVILRAKKAGVTHIILPNVDTNTIERLHRTAETYTGFCHAAMGLHPTSVNENYKESLAEIETQLTQHSYCAIGEIGIDLYWDKTFLKEQVFVFEQQIEWSIKYQLPIIVHMRDSYNEVIECLKKYKDQAIFGIFHSFTGNVEQAKEILAIGNFKLGINGIVTFKNSGLDKTVSQLKLEDLVIETDSPYLTPTPFRGKRNETGYIALVVQKLAEIYTVSTEEIDTITTNNAKKIFSNTLL
jgi:TatD DNase family protein